MSWKLFLYLVLVQWRFWTIENSPTEGFWGSKIMKCSVGWHHPSDFILHFSPRRSRWMSKWRAQPDEPFQNFWASRSEDHRFLCSSETSCDGFWSFKIVKRVVGNRPFRKFGAFKSVTRRFWTIQYSTISWCWGSKIRKGPVGHNLNSQHRKVLAVERGKRYRNDRWLGLPF